MVFHDASWERPFNRSFKQIIIYGSRTALGPTQTPIHWIPGALSLRIKRPGREADHSPPSSSEVKEGVELYHHFPNTPSWRGVQKKAQEQIYLYLYFYIYAYIHADIHKYKGY
jgi:hypothetical protein